MTGTYRSTTVLDKVHMTFFNSDYFGKMTHWGKWTSFSPVHISIKIEFEIAVQFHNEGYERSDDYDLPKLFIKSTHMYSISSTAETSFNPADYKDSTPTSPSTLKWRQVEFPLHQAVHRADSDSDTEEEDFATAALTWYGPKNPYQRDSYVFIQLWLTQQQDYPPHCRSPSMSQFLQNGNLWMTQVIIYPTSSTSLKKCFFWITHHHLGFHLCLNVTKRHIIFLTKGEWYKLSYQLLDTTQMLLKDTSYF